MRKAIFGVMIGCLVFATAAWALEQKNTVTYKSTVKYKGKPSKKKPRNTLYNGVLHVSTEDNKQPNTAPVTDVFFTKYLKTNGPKFKSCPQSAIDGKSAIPKSCNKAQVGDGTADALVGKPGNPEGSSLPQNLTVKAFNSSKGKKLLLALTGGALGSNYRVIPGTVKKLKGTFGFKVSFKVPKELQEPVPGSQIALTDFDVKIKTKRTVTIRKKQASYIQTIGCPKSKKMPTKTTVHFNDDANQPTNSTKTSRGTMACH